MATPIKDRILRAATAEFAARGFSGARMDGIAAAAGANKERIYAYFGPKNALFASVVAWVATRWDGWGEQSGSDLPGTMGDIFDLTFDSPETTRILAWRELEISSEPTEPELAQFQQKVGVIADAQARGLVDATWDPTDLLAIINALATAWSRAPRALSTIAEETGAPVRERRAAVERALRAIATAPPE